MAAVDEFVGRPVYNSLGGGAAVTPSDSVALTNVTRAIWVGGAGAIAVILQNGATVTLSGVPAGTMLWLRASQVKATGTTATLIVALW